MKTESAQTIFDNSRNQLLIDVRSPSEFNDGHIPDAINIPIFDDRERAIVGTLYKQTGRESAVEKGLELVGPKMASFVRQTREALQPDQKVYVHCWRGGMRSQSFAWLLSTAGFDVTVLTGGYKAFRKQALETLAETHPMVVLSGLTGAGKTRFLEMLATAGEQIIDLEGLANHRGSSFGAVGLGEQPSTQQFENQLFCEIQQLDRTRFFWIEDEGSRIGQVTVPETFINQVRHAPAVFLDVPKSRRLDNLCKEYGIQDKDGLVEATRGIERRLGGQNMNEAIALIEAGDMRAAANISLTYYDRAYLKSASKMPRTMTIDLNTADLSDDQVVDALQQRASELLQETAGKS